MDKDIAIFLILNVVILISGGFIIHELLETRINECIANPLIYGVNHVEAEYGINDLDCSCYSKHKSFNFNSSSYYHRDLETGSRDSEVPNLTELLQNAIIKK